MGIKKLLSVATFLVAGSLAHTAWAQEWTDITNGDGLKFESQLANPTSGDVFETWTNKAGGSFDLNQTVTNVPDGVYELSVNAMYRASTTYGTNTNCVLYANTGDVEFTAPLANFGDYTSPESLSGIGTQMKNNDAYKNIIGNIIVENGEAKIGIKSVGELAHCTNGYWFVCKRSSFNFKNVTESYFVELQTKINNILTSAIENDAKNTLESALETYNSANVNNIKGLQNAITTYLETVNGSTPVDVTSYMANPSFEGGSVTYWYQDLGYTQGSNRDVKQPTGWNLMYSSAKVGNTQYQSFMPQTDGARNGNCLYVRHRWGDVKAVEDLRQVVKNLPAGKYTLTVAVKGGASVSDANVLTISEGQNSASITIDNFDKENYKDYSVSIVKENDESVLDICYSLRQSSGNEQKYYIDDFRLIYYGNDADVYKEPYLEAKDIATATLNDAKYENVIGAEKTALQAEIDKAEPTTADGYTAATTALATATSVFTAAKTNYDNLVAEIAKAKALGIADADDYSATEAYTSATALEKTQALKVAEYEYVTGNYAYGVALGEWTSEATGTKAANFSNEHWSGTTHTYKNQDDSNNQGWNANSWSINFYQNVTLPAGDYVFKVAARQASGDQVNTTLIVKNGETILGSVSDFPRSSKSLGINKEGATSFDPEDPAGFANNNNGYGWEWRYVKFTLTEATIVNIAISSVATALHQWVSFGDYTLQTNNDANIAMIAYNIALNDANLALANNTYSVVTGSERDNLTTAINANPGTTAETINAAIEALNAATKAFTDAKASYDDLNAAKTEISAELPYASADKYEALNTAVEAVPANAEDAVAKAAAIRTANRLYVESNAMAEGVVDAVDMTSFITNPNFTVEGVGSDEGWTSSQSGGSKGVIDGEPLTDGNGVTHRYYDYWNGSANNQHVTQVVKNLPAGRYLFTVSARADANLNNVFVKIGDKQTVVNKIGSTGGTFGRGWNDYTVVYDNDKVQDVTLEIYSTSEGGNKGGWFGFTRARLVKIAEAANMSISEAQYGTFVAPFEVEIPEGVTASKITGIDANGYTVVEEVLEGTIPANTPVILFSEAVVNTTFYGTAVEGTATAGLLTGNLSGETMYAPMDSYILLNGENGIGFYRVVSDDVTVNNNRVYLTVPAVAEAKAFISFGDATSINGVTEGATEVVRYNAAGVKVNAPVKGLNIVKMSDGTVKKVMVK